MGVNKKYNTSGMRASLDTKYQQERGSVYLTGIQALVRLPLDQMRRDRRAGLRTAAFISGYEGSPLGGYDLALGRVKPLLAEHNIHFVPGVNEDLAATSVLGSQMHHILGQSRYKGVVGIWYGKGPGVDRSGDILRHANLAGTGLNCGALVLAGDDHLSKSSTIPHQSDFSFYNFGIPILHPGNPQEILDYGLLGIAISRFSGAWVGMKLVTNVCDGGGTVRVDADLPAIRVPGNYEKRSDARLVPPFTLALENEVNHRRLEAVCKFARLNSVNRSFGASETAWLGIAAAGKPYYDLMQAFRDMGIGSDDLAGMGVRVAKYGLTFPLEPEFTNTFARGLRTILVIEEKRSFLELQLRDMLYNSAAHPVVMGKQDERGRPLLHAVAELDPEQIVRVLGGLLPDHTGGRGRLAVLDQVEARAKSPALRRPPSFCPGCPHNRSTLLLEGQVAGGGIGCHGMAVQLQEFSRGYAFLTHMGGEGAPWIGMAPFVERPHIFQNIGDGTYFHSGSLAVEACIAAGVNITYKILYNGTVAMTGGQPVSGALSVPELARKLGSEGVRRVVVVTDDLSRYGGVKLEAGLRHRDDLPDVLRELERIPGVTAIIYDQQCAAEKRRLRSRGKLEQPVLRTAIHQEVCEGCGDCVQQSNCMSLRPANTDYGQKMAIHQSSCNSDDSCLLGDCPSFLSVKLKPGTGLRRKPLPELSQIQVPPPREKVLVGDGYSILAPGIGGTGVVTVNALIATAAWLDGLSVITLDQTGLSQKGGAVVSSVILSDKPIEAAAKIGYGNADLLLGFDLLGAANAENLRRAHPARTVAVVNTAETPTGDAVRALRPVSSGEPAVAAINAVTRPDRNVFVDASRLAETLFGSHLAANIFLLGVAYQAGLVPVSAGAMEEAVRLNNVEVERNLRAFLWGRRYIQDPAEVEALGGPPAKPDDAAAPLVERRAAELERYQNGKYAESYRAFITEVERQRPLLADAVARNLYKLMAYKDEYEVARLLTKTAVEAEIRDIWEQPEGIHYHLHPPLLRALGWKKKLRLGPWFRVPLRMLAALKPLRGTPFDPFGYARVRREERALIDWYRDLVLQCLQLEDLQSALEVVDLPDQIRGYEQIKLRKISGVRAEAERRLQESGSATTLRRTWSSG